ncbi:unnamed protein product, partial [Vitis vinifera]
MMPRQWWCSCTPRTCRTQTRAVGKNDVALGETFFNSGWRGYDNKKTGSETEGEDRTIFLRKSL